jgi:hypothetical protein
MIKNYLNEVRRAFSTKDGQTVLYVIFTVVSAYLVLGLVFSQSIQNPITGIFAIFAIFASVSLFSKKDKEATKVEKEGA